MKTRRKLLGILFATSAATSLVLGTYAAHLVSAATAEQIETRIHRELALFAGEVAKLADREAIQSLCARCNRHLDVRATAIAPDGMVLADSWVDVTREKVENHKDRPEVKQALAGGIGVDVRMSGTTGAEFQYSAMRVESGPVRVLRFAFPTAELNRARMQQILQLVGLLLVAFALVGFAAYLVVRRISRPVEAMSAAAQRVAAGDWSVSVPEPREEELGMLARAVNGMKAALVTRLAESQADQRLLLAMREGMEEGLLLVGPRQRILMDNAAFRRIFQVGYDPMGKLLGEVVRHPVIVRMVEEVLRGVNDARETVQGTPGSDRSFEIHASPVEIPGRDGQHGVLVLFFDITRLEALEKVRRQFVADVSHELRTPVTSIKGSIETMLDGGLAESPDARRFLEMARRQTDRMADLIADLTDLSLIETGAVRLDLHEVDVHELAREVALAVAQRHPQSRVEIRNEVEPGIRVQADRRRLEQVLINLVDNGVKFNRDGGWVVIAALREGGGVRITVEDTGVGIPQESHEKVFQRFFRVDRARSRDVGGTGLGLAIVKHLVHLHGGRVSVDSEPGRGSRFHVDLPAASPATPVAH